MQIACPSCEARYEVPDAALAPGRLVRCVRCRATWQPSGSAPATPSEDAPAARVPVLEPASAGDGHAPPSGPQPEIRWADPHPADVAAAAPSRADPAAAPDAAPAYPFPSAADRSDGVTYRTIERDRPIRAGERRGGWDLLEAPAEPPPARPSRLLLWAGWIATGLVLGGAVWAALAYEPAIEAAWPPSGRFYQAIGR